MQTPLRHRRYSIQGQTYYRPIHIALLCYWLFDLKPAFTSWDGFKRFIVGEWILHTIQHLRAYLSKKGYGRFYQVYHSRCESLIFKCHERNS